MKKILSLCLSVLMLFSMIVLPASADGTPDYVAITSVEDGAQFTEGDNINLKATTNTTGWSRIEFYANGDKIPGFITPDGAQVLTWYAPVSGSYALTAKLFYVTDAEPVESAPVNAVVIDKSAIMVFDGKDLTGVKYTASAESNEIAVTNEFLSNTQWKTGGNSLKVDLSQTGSKIEFDVNGLTDTKSYIYMWAYLSKDDVLRMTLYGASANDSYYVGENSYEATTGYTDGTSAVQNSGWHLLKIQQSATNKGLLESVAILGKYDDSAKEALTKYGDSIYIDKIWAVNRTTNPKEYSANSTITASPEIANGAEGVCTEVREYRVDFNGQMDIESMKDKFSVKCGSDDLAGVTYEYGVDYAKVILPTLTNGTTYTVSYKGSSDYLGCNVASAEWTFKTMEESCTGATPVPRFTYPANGATVGGNVRLVVDTMFVSKVKSVEFKNGNTSFGTVDGAIGSEWVLDTELAAGTYSDVKAVVTYTDDSTSEVTLGSLTVKTVSYVFNGLLGDGYVNKFVINNEFGYKFEKSVRIFDSEYTINAWYADTKATDVEKVEFYIDGVLADTVKNAPYVWDIPLTDLKEHSLTATVHDIYGDEHNFGPYKYQAVYSVGNSSVDSAGCTLNNGNNKTYEDVITHSKDMVVVDLDLMKTDAGARAMFYVGEGTSFNYTGTLKNAFAVSTVSANEWYHVTLNIDITNAKYSLYVDGVLAESGDVNKEKVKSKFSLKVACDRKNSVSIKNVEFKDAVSTTEEIIFVDSKLSDNTGTINGTVASGRRVVINNTNDEVSVVNIIAVYDENQLVNCVLDPVTIGSKGISNILYDNVAISKDGNTGTSVRLYTWDSLETIVPVSTK